MKKEATLKCKGLKPNTSVEKEATPKHKGLKPNTPDEKEATLKRKGLKQKTSDTNSKVRNHQLTEGRFINLTLKVRVMLFSHTSNTM
jgi:hypothetical protein